ncbi:MULTISPECIES: RNA polymerase sigma-70 factor [Flagellimonas]|jgi:RNA polymerase sigma-70 factor (ECF subfamily)|uniref:RNA polymerase sigma-70 factor n=1 Tax=Flagellimonas TaxID=444459 RepID=UPI00296F9F3D|nr:RNA polymerase sigma-70 factor [Muricauda sp. DH64]
MKREKYTESLYDKDLLSLMKKGNRLAFKQVYDKYWEGLYSATINILKDKGLTEDVIHDVFVYLWVKRETTKIQNLKSYLFQAVRNNALLKIRNQKFTKLHEEKIHGLADVPVAEQNLNLKDLELKIEKAANSLPARCKTIFYMSRFENYTITEIANHFGISHRTVENQLYLALKHLRIFLTKKAKSFNWLIFLSFFN